MDNTIVWPGVWSDRGGKYKISIRYQESQRLMSTLEVNGEVAGSFKTGLLRQDEKTAPLKTAEFVITLNKGLNTIRLYSPHTLMPPIDCILLERIR